MPELTRRDALRAGLVGLGALAAGQVVAACSSGTAKPAPTPSASPTGPLPPFSPGTAPVTATGLPRRVAWENTLDTEYFVALSNGMSAASKARDVEYLTANSGDDAATNVDQINEFLDRGLGALAIQPLNQTAQRPVLTQALSRGVCVQGIITDPCTLQVAASQYQIGFNQGKAAADYAVANLGGTAQVQYFNYDTISPQLVLRHHGVLDGLKTGGSGITVVSDLGIADATTANGFTAMNTSIEAHPGIDIVMGGDAVVVGAYDALKQAGKLRENMYLSGVDGDGQALDLVKEGTPYRASTAFAWQLMGYGFGQFGADWIEGKHIPRVMVAKGLLLDSGALVDDYRAANTDPGPVFADPVAFARYLPLLGSISYAGRAQTWQSEYVPQ